MPSSNRWSDRPDGPTRSGEAGSASLEFITVGMLLLIPVVYLVLAMAAIQGTALAIEGGARHAARVYVQATNESEARARAQRAMHTALADFGLGDTAVGMSVSCRPDPRACLVRRGLVTVSANATVALPLLPREWFAGSNGGVVVGSTATQQVSRFWSSDG